MIRILRATPCAIFPLLPTSLRDNFHYSSIQCYEKSEQRAAQTELLSCRGHLQDVSHARVGCQTPLLFLSHPGTDNTYGRTSCSSVPLFPHFDHRQLCDNEPH